MVLIHELIPNELWEIGLTHISDLGKLKYAHVIIDTFSGLLVATALTGKTCKNVINHFLFFSRWFVFLGLFLIGLKVCELTPPLTALQQTHIIFYSRTET